MSNDSRPAGRMRLGELLVTSGLIDEERLQQALLEQQKWGEPLGRTLVQMGLLPEELLAGALSRQLGLPACDPMAMELAPGTTGRLALHLVEQYGVMPVAADDARRLLYVATSDPTNQPMMRALASATGYMVHPVVAPASRIEQAIRKHYFGEEERAAPPPPPAAPAEAAAPAPPPAAPPQPDRLAELAELVQGLEQLTAGQLRALRALVELLTEKGVIGRDEWLARVRGEPPRES